MRFRKPELIPTLFIVASTLLLGSLGFWQLHRLGWKEALMAQITEAQSQPELTQLPDNVTSLSYRNVAVYGRFMNERALRLVGRKEGMRTGFFVLTPFTLQDGRVILVNRGFAEEGKEAPLDGIQLVKGILRPPREKRAFAPQNQVEKNLWFYEDIPVISAQLGTDLLPMVIEAVGTGYPIPNSGKITFRNDHLGYAITWFSLALIGLFMFAVYHRIPDKASAIKTS